ncbi:MAG TPA: hypothetical protein VGP81_06295 [Pyrinomonadaceae bacterium]|nr:hypothetical protein [Pyrinomonadaceae bacterium]
MKPILTTTGVVLTLIATAVFAFGDLARPKPSATPEAKSVLYSGLTIVTDGKAYDAKLQISEATLKRISEGAAREGGSASLIQNITHSSSRTMMAGLFMFLAVSFAGVWLARSNQRRHAKAIVAVLIVAFIFGVGTMFVRANAGPPGYIRWQNLPQYLKDGKPTYGGVEVEIVPGDENMKLIIPLRNK